MEEEKKLSKTDKYKMTKLTESAPFFKSTKVDSCLKVEMVKGQPVAVCYPQKKTGYKKENSYVNKTRSSESQSKSQYTHIPFLSSILSFYFHDVFLLTLFHNDLLICSNDFMVKEPERCGSMKKKLCPYNPNAPRNLLSKPDIVMHHKNYSSVVIGRPE
jgi:hypothetical protein